MLSWTLRTLTTILHLLSGTQGSSQGETWDELVFTQIWGYSECRQFQAESHGQLKCRYEGRPSIWTIHGIWPTKAGTFGPSYCSKVTFNEDLIAPIEDQMNEFWYEINADKDGAFFWSHEWTKHGSCAKELARMGTELKYFSTGLELRGQYDLYAVLKEGGIVPQESPTGYHLSDITGAIMKTLQFTPHVQCYEAKEEGKKVYYLLAIEICLNRAFELVDCKHEHTPELDADRYGQSSLCPDNVPIIYTDNFPKSRNEQKEL